MSRTLNFRGQTFALVAAAAVAGGAQPAAAADLGGNCCADLEERIAELEATTARKGNRKVSLEISGQINETLLFWDDGGESNVGVYTNDNSRSRFRFRGKAKIDADWEAGYQLEVGVRTANSKRFTQFNDNGTDNPADTGFDLRDSYWFLKHKTYGQGSVGLQASATDAITEVNLTQTADFAKYSDIEDSGLGLLLRSSANENTSNPTLTVPPSTPGQVGLSWRRLIGDGGDQPGEGERRFNGVKYTSAAVQGFTVSGFYGEDDFWDVGLRYANEFSGFKLAAGFGYGEQKDGPDIKTVCNAQIGGTGTPAQNQKCHQFGGSLSLIHVDTGLFVNFGAGKKIDDLLDQTPRFIGTGADDEQTFWALQAGIEKKWLSYGKTTIYGEYYDYDGGANSKRTVSNPALDGLAAASGFANSGIWSTGVQSYGAGIAQGFDAAALTLYLSYRHIEGDLTLVQVAGSGSTSAVSPGTNLVNVGIEDLDVVLAGGIIKF